MDRNEGDVANLRTRMRSRSKIVEAMRDAVLETVTGMQNGSPDADLMALEWRSASATLSTLAEVLLAGARALETIAEIEADVRKEIS